MKLNIEEQLAYLNDNGIKHHGVVVTGPMKGLSKLQNEEFINAVAIAEVGFWNWDSIQRMKLKKVRIALHLYHRSTGVNPLHTLS